MPGGLEFDEKYPGTDPTDFTKDGRCSRCGGCCSSLIPATGQELHRLAKYAAEHGIEPKLPAGDDMIYLKCPFWQDARGPALGRCLVYGIRPAVCRHFICSSTNRENARAWIEHEASQEPPDPVNMWSIFGKTGLKSQGREILYHAAPFCRVRTKSSGSYEFHVGRPVALILSTGERIPPSMVLNISSAGLQLFDTRYANAHPGDPMRLIAFSDIHEVLTAACHVEDGA